MNATFLQKVEGGLCYWAQACLLWFLQGKCGDGVGFFPANFVQRVRPGERVWRVTQAFNGCREKGQMTVKASQVSTQR